MMKTMKRILAPITIIATLFLMSFLAFQARAEETAPPLVLSKGDFSQLRKSGKSTVSEVINPMTIKLKDGRMIALAGLDYPDLDYYDPGELAVTAQKVLEDILTGKKVTIYQTPKSSQGRMNRMGHYIAHLERINDVGMNEDVDAAWVQGLMLSLGLARVRTTKYNRQMADQMLKLEKEARDLRVGLWKMDEYTVLTPELATKHIGSFQVVEGKIKSVSSHKNNLYINFGGDWRKDFTIGIGGATMRGFNRERIYPRNWNAKKVRVRGWIESYNGPFIEVNHPERIELLTVKSKEEVIKTKKKADSQDKPITFDGTALPHYNQ